jgi:hypothetical protein
MAAGVGLAGWALAARWGVRRWGAGLFVVLAAVCVIVGRLVAGRSENFLTLWLLAGALGVAAWDDGWKGKVGAGLLIFVAGLTEWPFLAAFLVILACALLVSWAADRWNGRGERGFHAGDGHAKGAGGAHPRGPGVLTLRDLAVVSLVASAAAALVVFVWNGTTPADAIQALPPSSRYEFFLRDTLPEYFPVVTAALTLIGWWAARRRSSPELEPSRLLLTTWAIITALVVGVGLAGAPLPTYRALMFALPVVLALAAAPLLSAGTAATATGKRRATSVALAALLAGGVLVPGALLWYRGFRPRTTAEALGQIARAGEYAAALGPGQAVVITYGDSDVLKAFLYRRVLEAVLPAVLRERLLIFPGTGRDALAGRVVPSGDPSVQAAIRELFAEVRPRLEAGAPIVAARNLDSSGFHEGTRRGSPMMGEDIVILRGPPPAEDLADRPTEPLVPLPTWWVLLLQSSFMLGVLILSGLGWAGFLVPRAPAAVRIALAPVFGVAALSMASLLAVRAGFSIGDSAGTVVVLVALVASASLLLLPAKRPA